MTSRHAARKHERARGRPSVRFEGKDGGIGLARATLTRDTGPCACDGNRGGIGEEQGLQKGHRSPEAGQSSRGRERALLVSRCSSAVRCHARPAHARRGRKGVDRTLAAVCGDCPLPRVGLLPPRSLGLSAATVPRSPRLVNQAAISLPPACVFCFGSPGSSLSRSFSLTHRGTRSSTPSPVVVSRRTRLCCAFSE